MGPLRRSNPSQTAEQMRWNVPPPPPPPREKKILASALIRVRPLIQAANAN